MKKKWVKNQAVEISCIFGRGSIKLQVPLSKEDERLEPVELIQILEKRVSYSMNVIAIRYIWYDKNDKEVSTTEWYINPLYGCEDFTTMSELVDPLVLVLCRKNKRPKAATVYENSIRAGYSEQNAMDVALSV